MNERKNIRKEKGRRIKENIKKCLEKNEGGNEKSEREGEARRGKVCGCYRQAREAEAKRNRERE